MSPKILVVYYSFEGNTRFIAEMIAKTYSADLLSLAIKDEMQTHGFMKYVWGGRQVFHRMRPELLPFNTIPTAYDILFIGTPVWAFTYTPALRTFLETVRLRGKKIALFCCHEGIPGGTIRHMKTALSGNEIIGECTFRKALARKGESTTALHVWLQSLSRFITT